MVSCAAPEIAVLLRDDAITNVVYSVGSPSGEMTSLCVEIAYDVIDKSVTAASTSMSNSSTTSTTAERSLLLVRIMVMGRAVGCSLIRSPAGCVD